MKHRLGAEHAATPACGQSEPAPQPRVVETTLNAWSRALQTTIACPATGATLEFELPDDDQTLLKLWQHEIRVGCPECGDLHGVLYRRAYAAGVLAAVRCEPVDATTDALFH